MENFSKVSLDSISIKDLLLIIKALEYTHEHTELNAFMDLRNSILKELCFLTETSEEEFLNYIESHTNI